VVKGAMKTIPKQNPGLFDYPSTPLRVVSLPNHENRMRKLEEGPDPLARLNAGIDWEMFRPNLERAFEKEAKGPGGRPRHDVVMMFKILVLQRYYNLSDEQAEYQIKSYNGTTTCRMSRRSTRSTTGCRSRSFWGSRFRMRCRMGRQFGCFGKP